MTRTVGGPTSARRSLRCAAILVVAWTSTIAVPAQDPGGYRFEHNGKSFSPEVWSAGRGKETPSAGGLIEVHDAWLVLGEPGHYRFRAGSRRDASVWASYAGGAEVAVVARASDVPNLAASARGHLRGVVLDDWEQGTLDAVAALPLDRVALTVRTDVVPERGVLPALPAGTRFLNVLVKSGGVRDWSALRALPELRAFRANDEYFRRGPLDLTALAGCKSLEVLDCREHAVDAEALFALSSVRLLEVELAGAVAWKRFAGLRELRHLHLRDSTIDDLSGIATLPHLVHLSVESESLTHLPSEGFERLQSLGLGFLTRVPGVALRAFERAHPRCAVMPHLPLNAELRDALAGCDGVVVRSGHPTQQEELFTAGRDAVAALRAALDVREDTSWFGCMCLGHPHLEFRRGGATVLTISVHHGHSIRWRGGPWHSDAELTEAAQVWLCSWLALHGVPEPEKERDERLARRRSESKR